MPLAEPQALNERMVELAMRFLPRAGNYETDPLLLFYFHLEALETSVIHPKYMDDQLVSQLALTDSDLAYATAVTELVDRCSGRRGSPTSSVQRATIMAAIEKLRKNAPSSDLDYRFSLLELERLEAIVTSMSN